MMDLELKQLEPNTRISRDNRYDGSGIETTYCGKMRPTELHSVQEKHRNQRTQVTRLLYVITTTFQPGGLCLKRAAVEEDIVGSVYPPVIKHGKWNFTFHRSFNEKNQGSTINKSIFKDFPVP